jgi:3-phenylpropionate/trans-cinnamate dioxygenase ferredoxin reductase subunit
VVAIDPGAHQVVLADGERVDYHQLLLSTGASPRHLDVPGAELDGVHYLRTLADCDRLKAAATEVTASLRHVGIPVTLLDVASVPLERVLGPEVGAVYHGLHSEHGVTMLMDSGLASMHGSSQVQELRTTDGRSGPADLVVVGIGATPRTELASAGGLNVDNGVVVDEYLRTSAPDIFAAGDVAGAWHPLYDEHLRVEHWAKAQNQGIAAAANMLGNPTPYQRIPYFFSDQYDLGMEYSGHAQPTDQVVFRGDPASREFIAFWLRGGVVVAGMNANVWDVTTPIQQLIRERAHIGPARLADPDIPLDEFLNDPVSS